MFKRIRVLLPLVTIVLIVALYLFLGREEARFVFDLATPRMIIEAGSSTDDLDVTSGGALIITSGSASTLTGKTVSSDPWYIANPENQDENKIRYPQIVFRAITPEKSLGWSDYHVTLSLTPTEHVLSQSIEVDGTDGIFLFMHYQDQDNLYVAGISKDGRMFIKRKAHGLYSLIADLLLFEGEYSTNENLISPFENAQIVLSGIVRNIRDGTVSLTVKVQITDPEGVTVVDKVLSGSDGEGLFHSGRAGFRLDSIEALINTFTVEPIG